ncbi:SDR family NAD(P)-dependent oxidoreductase [Aetokthonos hydrillicola Thurmond2011]|uniref:SDR family NAD(P)-dependent oxidoreductase n=1 Tax=Aetokthonos hydrillicola Thurmond2011 TaxID=2712845 RepID=A0AAP5IF40_9CYAN|nr:SDR family NAD(P)-dependent oxidoreductase [Aetokthonos hydrillicola]MBO3462734.1 SDR family NAD(P)-dependent oxidoreductase [Aetokthonos hydrillicola CCALA 1050]MBW4585740.1 SDR family NAD(P)-dependent oxidoreductase [Aetokthonos hydrillicola CCALA 1050]MDR9899244.1 SDR family NAD(P)-dependent oxidoreductase [Aetokthonos hydrillicola Thurmond2011]
MVIATKKAVFVTGASTGIGKACALHLDKLGFRVFASVRKEADADALKAIASTEFTPILMDIVDGASITLAAETIAAAVSDIGLAGLVNNAGTAIISPLELLEIRELRHQFEVNLFGQLAVTQAFLPLLRKSQGRVVNIGSIIGKVAVPFLGSNCAAKFGMEALTDVLRMELRPWGISVSIIEPGYVATPIWDKVVSIGNETAANLPPYERNLYSGAIASACKSILKSSKAGIQADFVAKAVAHALTSKNPKTRYLVGRDAKLAALVSKFLPDRVLDRVIAQ